MFIDGLHLLYILLYHYYSNARFIRVWPLLSSVVFWNAYLSEQPCISARLGWVIENCFYEFYRKHSTHSWLTAFKTGCPTTTLFNYIRLRILVFVHFLTPLFTCLYLPHYLPVSIKKIICSIVSVSLIILTPKFYLVIKTNFVGIIENTYIGIWIWCCWLFVIVYSHALWRRRVWITDCEIILHLCAGRWTPLSSKFSKKPIGISSRISSFEMYLFSL